MPGDSKISNWVAERITVSQSQEKYHLDKGNSCSQVASFLALGTDYLLRKHLLTRQ